MASAWWNCRKPQRAAYCGRLLAGLGAEVTMLEPHSGSPLRRKGPFRDDVPDLEGGATHLHLNRRKGSLRIDLCSAAGRRLFDSRLDKTEVLIVDVDRRRWCEFGLDPDAIRTAQPDLHVCLITPYGIEGPKANWLGSELTLYAAGGYLRIGGEPDREPVKAWGEQGHLQVGLHAALGIVSALYADSRGQQIDTAVYEALAFLLGGGYQHAWFSDSEPMRNGARLVGFGPGHLYPSTIRPCADGWVHAHCNNRYPEAMAVLFDQPRLAEPDLLATLMGHADEVDELMAPVLMQTPRRDVVKRAQELRIPFTEVLGPIGSHGRRRRSPCIERLLADHRASSGRGVSGVGSGSEVWQVEVGRWHCAASGPGQRAARFAAGSCSLEACRCCLNLS